MLPFILFSLLHRACCRVTQLLYQLLHIYKVYKMCPATDVHSVNSVLRNEAQNAHP